MSKKIIDLQNEIIAETCALLLRDAVHNALQMGLNSMSAHSMEDLTLLAPAYILQGAIEFEASKWLKNPPKVINAATEMKLYGYNVGIGYENKIIIFHKDYPTTQNPKHIYQMQMP